MFTPARIISSLSKSLFQQMQKQNIPKLSVVSTAMFHTCMPMHINHSKDGALKDARPTGSGSRHGGLYKRDYKVLRERPVGPHKKLPPGDKYLGRVGPHENYRRILHYPKVFLKIGIIIIWALLNNFINMWSFICIIVRMEIIRLKNFQSPNWVVVILQLAEK